MILLVFYEETAGPGGLLVSGIKTFSGRFLNNLENSIG
jgi:hypothetical protein